jgi:hypothetical protein
MEYESKQDLVTVRIPREVRDDLKKLAKNQSRSMVKQIEYMVKKELSRG